MRKNISGLLLVIAATVSAIACGETAVCQAVSA